MSVWCTREQAFKDKESGWENQVFKFAVGVLYCPVILTANIRKILVAEAFPNKCQSMRLQHFYPICPVCVLQSLLQSYPPAVHLVLSRSNWLNRHSLASHLTFNNSEVQVSILWVRIIIGVFPSCMARICVLGSKFSSCMQIWQTGNCTILG